MTTRGNPHPSYFECTWQTGRLDRHQEGAHTVAVAMSNNNVANWTRDLNFNTVITTLRHSNVEHLCFLTSNTWIPSQPDEQQSEKKKKKKWSHFPDQCCATVTKGQREIQSLQTEKNDVHDSCTREREFKRRAEGAKNSSTFCSAPCNGKARGHFFGGKANWLCLYQPDISLLWW